jgi:hypothetical protein
LLISILPAVDENLPADAFQLAHAGLALLFETPASQFSLPAAGAEGISSTYTNLFQMADLPVYSLFAAQKWHQQKFGFGCQMLNHPAYHEMQWLANYRGNWHFVQLGINGRYIQEKVAEENSASVFVADAGLGFVQKSLRLSFAVHNIGKNSLAGEELPVSFISEIVYDLQAQCRLGIGLEKQPNYDVAWRLGTMYELRSNFALHAGYQFQPDRFSGGLQFQVAHVSLMYAVQTHTSLDLTHAVSLAYQK